MTDFMPRISIVVKYKPVIIGSCVMHNLHWERPGACADGGNSWAAGEAAASSAWCLAPSYGTPCLMYILLFQSEVYL